MNILGNTLTWNGIRFQIQFFSARSPPPTDFLSKQNRGVRCSFLKRGRNPDFHLFLKQRNLNNPATWWLFLKLNDDGPTV